MGRPLKISKYSAMSGIFTTGPTAAGVPVDVGYPDFASLDDAVYNSPQSLTSDQYLGVVGGFQEGQVSTTNPVVLCTVNLNLNDGTSTGAGSGRILRQKGAHKYLVAKADDIQDENIIAGNTYMIVETLGTDWAQFGAGINAGPGDVFTATIDGSAATVANGYVWDVGQCILSNTASPAAGYMSVGYTFNSGVTVYYLSNLTNKWLRNWTGSPGNYSNSNTGEVDYSSEAFYVANFFTNAGTVTWSGAELVNGAYAQNGTVYVAQVDNLTS